MLIEAAVPEIRGVVGAAAAVTKGWEPVRSEVVKCTEN
jgi:hypothetical protein